MDYSAVVALLASIRASDHDERARAADEVTDICRSLTTEQAELVARELVAARLQEKNPVCQEAQLNALGDLKVWQKVPLEVFVALLPIKDDDLGQQKEYLDDLLTVDDE